VKNEQAAQGVWEIESPSGVQGWSPGGSLGAKKAEKLSKFT